MLKTEHFTCPAGRQDPMCLDCELRKDCTEFKKKRPIATWGCGATLSCECGYEENVCAVIPVREETSIYIQDWKLPCGFCGRLLKIIPALSMMMMSFDLYDKVDVVSKEGKIFGETYVRKDKK